MGTRKTAGQSDDLEQDDVVVVEEQNGIDQDQGQDQDQDQDQGQDQDQDQNQDQDQDQDDSNGASDNEGSEIDELVVQIGDEEPEESADPSKAPEWVRELRKQQRELQKRNRELEEQLKTVRGADESVPKLAKKPSLEDFDYDPDKFEAALEQWHTQKRKVDEFEQTRQREIEEQQKVWRDRLEAYGNSIKQLKAKDYEDVEARVQDTLNVVQQGVIVQGANNPALVVYALGKNPKRAKELAAIKDPVKFAFAIAALEKDLKVVNPNARKTPPAPPRTVRGSAPISGSAPDSALERLRAEAARTGDYTKVIQYKTRMKQQRG